MQESSVYQHLLVTTAKEHYERGFKQGIEQGFEQGIRHNALETVLSVLEYKFNSFTVRMLRPLLEDIVDIQVLMDLQKVALQSQNREDFIQHLEGIEDIAKQV